MRINLFSLQILQKKVRLGRKVDVTKCIRFEGKKRQKVAESSRGRTKKVIPRRLTFLSSSKGWIIVVGHDATAEGSLAPWNGRSFRMRLLVYEAAAPRLNRLLTNRDKCSIIGFIKVALRWSAGKYYCPARVEQCGSKSNGKCSF